MNDTRLIRLIRTFTKEELKSFEKFLQSPFLRPARDTSELYDYIMKCFPDYDSPKLEKEKCFKKLFPGEDYNEKKLLNLIFDLTKAAENFIAFNMSMEYETDYLLNLSKAYLKRNMSDESNRINKTIEKKLKPGFSDQRDYISKFRKLSFLRGAYYSDINDFEKLILNEKDNFEASAVQFIIDYTHVIDLITTAKNTYEIDIKNDFVESVIKSFDLENLLKLLEKSENKNKHLILLHYYLLKSKIETDDFNYYELLRDLFFELIPELDRSEKCFIFNYLVTYCIRKFGNDKSMIKERLRIYKAMLENNAYSESESEYLQVPAFRNIIHTCLSLNETEWFEYFIKNYSECLHPQYRDDLINFAYAHLHFIKKDFEKSLLQVSEIDQDLFLFKPDLKHLMLQIYYELNHIEAAFSMVDSYKHFLSNTAEVSVAMKKFYVNFLNFYLNLLKLKSGQSREKAEYYIFNIEKEKEVVNKIWLLEKANQLNKTKNKK